MNPPRILLAGVGNLFLGDDAFGCEVARRLAQIALPEGVRVVDFGIRSLDLTYALLEPWDAVILMDAMPRGNAPGTLYLIEPHVAEMKNVMMDGHSMDPVKVLEAVAALGGHVDCIFVLGCEPTPRDADADWEASLSDQVRAAIDEAMEMVQSLVKKIMDEHSRGGPVPLEV